MRGISAVDTVPVVNLARLDLNLLVALDALLQQRSVTRAAEQMGLSQPAVSAQLGRLRRHFHDELLARSGNQYRLTPLAIQLKERVRAVLSGAERVFAAEPDFDRASSTREFSVLISDYAVATLGVEVARLLAREAPGTRLRMISNTTALVDDAARTLVNIDLMVIPHGFVEDLPHRDLYRDEWACLVSAGNDDVGDALTVEQLAAMPWVVTYHGPTAYTPAVRQMRMSGVEPNIQVITETFLTVPGLVRDTGRVALLQRRLADRVPAELGVRVLPCPVKISPLVEAMWWHPMHDDDPEHRYLRDVFARAAAVVIDDEAHIDAGDSPLRQK